MHDDLAGLITADDLQVGDEFELGSYTVTLEEMLAFSRQWDPQDFHVDVQAAEQGYFGGVIASGLHTMAIVQRLWVTSNVHRWAVIAGSGLRDVKFLLPVRPGQTLTARVRILDIDLERPDRGRVTKQSLLFDAEDSLVLEMVSDAYLKRRAT